VKINHRLDAQALIFFRKFKYPPARLGGMVMMFVNTGNNRGYFTKSLLNHIMHTAQRPAAFENFNGRMVKIISPRSRKRINSNIFWSINFHDQWFASTLRQCFCNKSTSPKCRNFIHLKVKQADFRIFACGCQLKH